MKIPLPGGRAESLLFTDDEIGQFVTLAKTLERIHRRLEFDGYVIKNGEIIPPKNDKISYEEYSARAQDSDGNPLCTPKERGSH